MQFAPEHTETQYELDRCEAHAINGTGYISNPIVMASAAGWYVGQICADDGMVVPYDRLTVYMTLKEALLVWEYEFAYQHALKEA